MLPGVKWLLIINVAVFVPFFLARGTAAEIPFRYFELFPSMVLHLALWQLASYLFLHATVGHILFNMLLLWFFGAMLEGTWGTRRFLHFYFVCGIGAGIMCVIADVLTGGPNIPTIGASGAIFGVMLAVAILYPNEEVWVFLLFPIKMKWVVAGLAAINLLYFLKSPEGAGVSYVAHLGGLVIGYLYMKSGWLKFDVLRGAQRQYGDWKTRRAHRKFQVYLGKRNSDRDRWVH